MRSPEFNKVIIAVAREQGGFPPDKAICPLCGQSGATDPHHWLVKRSSGLPAHLIDVAINIVLLCHKCHMTLGQRRDTTMRLAEHKIALGYDFAKWRILKP